MLAGLAGNEWVAFVLWLGALQLLGLGVAFALGFLRGHAVGMKYADGLRAEWEARHVRRTSAGIRRGDKVTR